MRPIKQLLIILRDYIIEEKPIQFGICSAISDMKNDNIISLHEYAVLISFINYNRPSPWNKYYNKKLKKFAYFWPGGDFVIRTKWLNHAINHFFLFNLKYKIMLFFAEL